MNLRTIFCPIFDPCCLRGLIVCLWMLQSFLIHAQVFQQTEISAIQQMSNNWGTAVADYDQDGDLDIFMVAYDGFEAGQPQTWSRLLQNNGSALWVDVTLEAGLGQQYQSDSQADHKIGVAWGDYDNDGFPDLLLTHSGYIQLYHNQQDGRFEDVSQQSNINTCAQCVNTSALWWDYDNDGNLDVYISDYEHANQLYRNQGDGSFVNETEGTGVGDDGSSWCSIAFDANKDGWMDLYVVNDYGFSRLYLNDHGKLFREATQEYGLVNTGSAMGIAVGDYNSDGHFDIYVTNISEFQPNPLFRGSESGVFSNMAQEQKVGNGHWGWGTQFLDADHDGDEDIYVVNGFGSFTYSNTFFKSSWAQGVAEFTDGSAQAGCDGNAHGMGLEVFDYDSDGDLDMLVANTNGSPYLYQNTGVSGGTNWLQIDLEGSLSNRNAFGAIVKVSGSGRSLYRYHHGAGIMSQSIKPVHFGLGEMKIIDTLTVFWPGNGVEEFYDIPTNQTISIVENTKIEWDSAASEKPLLPDDFSVRKTFPNPFEESIFIDLQTPGKGSLRFQILSSSGQMVYQEDKGPVSEKQHRLVWDGTNVKGIRQGSGMYFYRIVLDDKLLTGKIMLR